MNADSEYRVYAQRVYNPFPYQHSKWENERDAEDAMDELLERGDIETARIVKITRKTTRLYKRNT